MDIEQLRHKWQTAKLNNDLLEADNRRLAEKLAAGRAATAREKLIRYYRMSVVCAALLPLLSPLLVEELGFPVWIAGLYALFGIVMCVLNICFLRYIRHQDIMSLPIVSALASAVKIRQYQMYLRVFGLFTGGALIVTMFTNVIYQSEYHTIIAFLVGLVIGLVLCVKKKRRMSALTRQMQEELKSVLSTADVKQEER